MKNYYAVLGVQKADSDETIKQAYRKLAKKYHPDLNPNDAGVKTKFQEVGEAWETLGNPEKRQKYDDSLLSGSAAKPRQSSGRSNRPADAKVNYEDIMRGFQDFFSEDKIKKKPASTEKNPIDTSGIFEDFMNFGKKKP